MTAQIQAIHQITNRNEWASSRWQTICYLGGITALLTVMTALSEILITFLPGGYTTAETVTEWFALLQDHPFLGLRNLGLLNIVMIAFSIPMLFTLYWIHRKTNPQ